MIRIENSIVSDARYLWSKFIAVEKVTRFEGVLFLIGLSKAIFSTLSYINFNLNVI